MKKYLVPFLFLSSIVHASDCKNDSTNYQIDAFRKLASMKESYPIPLNSSKPESAERSGCCSHHKGVCGCSNGRAVCCDGSFSPTCGCN